MAIQINYSNRTTTQIKNLQQISDVLFGHVYIQLDLVFRFSLVSYTLVGYSRVPVSPPVTSIDNSLRSVISEPFWKLRLKLWKVLAQHYIL